MTTTARSEQSVQSAGQVEIRSIDYVPVRERHGKPWHLGPVWFQGNAQLSTLAVGAIGVSLGLNLIWALIAIILGTLIGTLFMAFHSAQGIIMVFSLPGLVAVTAMNMYSGGLSTLTTVDTIKRIRPTFTARWISIGFITVAGTVLALTQSPHFLENFDNYLSLILYFMIPWTAVNLIDFFYVRKGNYAIRELFIPRGLYGMWSWRGLSHTGSRSRR